MKILMVSSYLPYPLHSGGHVRLYNLIKELSGKHEITLICEKRPHQTRSDIAEVEKICQKVITVPRKKQWSIENIIKSATSAHSFLVTGHTHPQMQQEIQNILLEEKFDLIHVETFYVMQNLLTSRKIPVVLVEHNIEYSVYKKFMDRVPFLIRPFLAIDIAKIKKEEEAAWKKAEKVVAVSQEDKRVMSDAGINALVVSNGVNINQFVYKPKNPLETAGKEIKKLLYIGDFKWLQNTDAVQFIIRSIFPAIKQKVPHAKLWIVARNIPDSIRNLTNDSSILFDEKSSAKPTPEIFQEADVLLAPIRIGGGTSYKILESMSSGTPVVTMPMSATAIHAQDSEDIMIGKNAEELAEKTVKLLNNEKLYARLAQSGRKLIEQHYSWKEIAKRLEEVWMHSQ